MIGRRRRPDLPYCMVCRSRYRGLYGPHASTQRHLKNLARGGHRGNQNRADVNAALGIRRLNVRRALAGRGEEGLTKVRAYKRRRPLDGPGFTVKVKRYWREIPWRPTKLPW